MTVDRRTLAIAGAVALAACVGYLAGASAQESQPKNSLSERYAKAQLRLAELNLQRAQEMNRRVPNTLTPSMMAQFSDDVTFAKARVESINKSGDYDPFQAELERARLNVALAEARLKKATETSQRIAGVISKSDLERLQLSVELARLRLERGQAVAKSDPHVKLHWLVENVCDDLNEVEQYTYLLGQNRFPGF